MFYISYLISPYGAMVVDMGTISVERSCRGKIDRSYEEKVLE